jgi:tetratricopeptide (TPR) repeat protein
MNAEKKVVEATQDRVDVGLDKRRYANIWLVAGLVALLVVAGAISWIVLRHSNTPAASNTPTAQSSGYKALEQKTSQLDRAGKYSEQAQQIEDYLKTNPPKDQQAAQLHQLGAAYMNAKEYQKAIDTFKKMSALDPQYAVAAYHGEAFAYEGLGDKPSAIDVYKKAIAAMRAEGGTQAQSAVAIDEAAVKHLGGAL